MPTFTVPKTPLAKGPGTLLWATPGTALPDYTVASSVYSVNAWTGWQLWGITKDGSEWGYDLDTDPIKCAEYVDDIDQVTTGRVVTVKFEIMIVTATIEDRALNRPGKSTTGSGTTLNTTVFPPDLGNELYCMIGWQSTDDTERIVAENAFQIGSLKTSRKKGADVGTYQLEYKFFPNASGKPYRHDFAGAARG